jgi:hypothetical protein
MSCLEAPLLHTRSVKAAKGELFEKKLVIIFLFQILEKFICVSKSHLKILTSLSETVTSMLAL